MNKPSDIKPAYAGEAMLIGWGESDTAGIWVKFQLPEDSGLMHPFKGIKKKQFMEIVCVMKDEYEQPVSRTSGVIIEHARVTSTEPDSGLPVVPSEVAGEGQDTRRTYSRSQMAAIKCRDREFQKWLFISNIEQGRVVQSAIPDEEIDGERVCEGLLKFLIGISSKTELDTNPEKAAAWDALLTDYMHKDQVR